MRGILIDVWYRPSRDARPGVYMLWVRTDSGVVCLEDRNFRPSFSAIPEKNAALVEQAIAQHENVSRAETTMRYPSLYADEQVPVIRVFMVDERKSGETMREIRQRAPAPVRFAESKIRENLQWHYLRNIAPHTIVNVEECNGILRHIESAGPCDPSDMHVLAIDPIFSSRDPRKCRLLSIALFDGAGERTLNGTEAEILRDFQSYLDASDPDVLALFDADSEKLPLLGLRAGPMKLRLGRMPLPTKLYESRINAGRISHWQSPQVRAPGRIIIDMWKDARTDADLKRTDMSLDSIYRQEIGDLDRCSGAAMVYRVAQERLPMFASWCERCMMPLDSVTREKHGFMNASMVNAARIRTTVIPEEAEYPEGFKTSLVQSIKENGGLVITPEAGLHEDVAILDFTSLISPHLRQAQHQPRDDQLQARGVPPSRRARAVPRLSHLQKAQGSLSGSFRKGAGRARPHKETNEIARSVRRELPQAGGHQQIP